ncbi:F0F1 ATP synthase subunit A [Actinomyces slackii]|uniref:ATP synthase subunit a n=1 Tax=Actinomyces slackii TaxID=52774 RepID=A0A3S4SF08_9ACTO|nr:F0F1 ATP synthase subunit A [Actinomyces slackii]VEG74528.1 F-ATPase subunit 6 [Actinomyces slackii]
MCAFRTLSQDTQEDTLSTQTVTDDAATTSTAPGAHAKPRWYWACLVVLVAIIAATAVPAFTQHPHAPGIGDFFPASFLAQGTVLEVNRLILVRLVMGLALCLIVAVAALRLKQVPGRGQAALELVAEFVREGIGVGMLGNRQGRRFAPYLTTVFLGVLAMNLAGILPGLNIAASSVIAVPLVFALTTYVTFIGAGIRAQGLGAFLVSQLFPPGLPKAMYLLITPIELLSTFVVRPVTLTLRLLCNMVAGHLLLAMTYLGTTTLLMHLQATSAVAALTGAAMIIMTLFEVFVAVLQAYIFTILSAVYIKLSIEAH